MRALPHSEEEYSRLPNIPGRFSWHKIVNASIEGMLFHDKRRKLTVYEKFPFDFIGTES
jgi:hypothetical protein